MRILLALLLLFPLIALAAPAVTPGHTVLVATTDPAALSARGFAAERLAPVGVRGDLGARYHVIDGGDQPAATLDAVRRVPGVAAAMIVGTRQLFWAPNDPYLGTQWYAQAGNPAGVRLAEAWDLETGDASVVIAVIDTGVDWSHPDLASKVWQNPGEIPGNGIDDDGNGFIDDIRGWDCGNNDNDARPESYTEGGIEVGFHGTHCAGIAAAATDNGVGVAGAAPGCLIMPLKVNNSASQITDAAIVLAFVYAIENGADVLSMSFGGPGDGGAAAFFQDLVDQALAAGVVPVAAAGNNNDASLMYPAACDGVISVGATDEAGQRASFSTYGDWVTVNAPGNRIWSTIQSNYDFDFLSGLLFQFANGWDGTNPYMYSDGTSMACPLVAGVVGLVLSRAPGLTPAEVTDLLLQTGDQVSFDQPLGVKVDAEAALLALDITAAPPAPGVLAVGAAPNPFNPRTTLWLSVDREGPVWVDIVDLRGRQVRRLAHGRTLSAGDHALVWDGRDDAGRAQPSGVYLARMRAGVEERAAKLLLAR